MQSLTALTEEIALALVAVAPTDSTALARVRRRLGDLARCAAEPSAGPEAAAQAARVAATRADAVIQQIVAGQSYDAAAALASVGAVFAQLQETLRAAAGAEPTSEAAALEDAAIVREFAAEALGHLQLAEAQLLKLENDPASVEAIDAIFRSFHTLKGTAGFLNLQQIGALAHAGESLLDLVRQSKLAIAGPVADLVLESVDRMKSLVGALDQAVRTNQPPALDEAVPSLVARLQECCTGGGHPPATPAMSASPAQPASATPSPAPSAATVKVTTDRLDGLTNRVGELVIAHSMVRQEIAVAVGSNQQLARNIARMSKIVRELQDLSMAMRMVPVQGSFRKMGRVVRDLARKAGKQVELIIAGETTELDRNLVEAIEDPLVHMVRNAVDHGIETPEDRQRAGKPAAGRIRLEASHQAGNVVIEVSDDGRGLDRPGIIQRAVAAGLIKPDDQLDVQDIDRLIFHAGLSTAESLTDVSGRGVGMDIVRRNVEALRGRIDINSTPGRGTTFILRLPLTLALIDGLLARVGTETYVLPLINVEQSLRISSAQLSTVQGRGEICRVRGSLLPLFRLHKLFHVAGASAGATEGLIVIVHDNQRRCCLLVDELIGQQQVVIKSLGESLGGIQAISGGAILGDGNVSLIVNVPGLMDLAMGKWTPAYESSPRQGVLV